MNTPNLPQSERNNADNSLSPRKRAHKCYECGNIFVRTGRCEILCPSCHDAVMATPDDKDPNWLDKQPKEVQTRMFDILLEIVAAVTEAAAEWDAETDPTQQVVDNARQAHCDAVATTLLAEVEI